jgi:hypothetical protein
MKHSRSGYCIKIWISIFKSNGSFDVFCFFKFKILVQAETFVENFFEHERG